MTMTSAVLISRILIENALSITNYQIGLFYQQHS